VPNEGQYRTFVSADRPTVIVGPFPSTETSMWLSVKTDLLTEGGVADRLDLLVQLQALLVRKALGLRGRGHCARGSHDKNGTERCARTLRQRETAPDTWLHVFPPD
jgi:hypothetical protein